MVELPPEPPEPLELLEPPPQPRKAVPVTSASAKARQSQDAYLRRMLKMPRAKSAPPPRKSRSILLSVGKMEGGIAEAPATSMFMVRVALEACVPSGVTEVGLTLQVACVGAPEQASVVGWLKPLAGVMEMVEVALAEDAETVPLVLPSAMVKSAAGGGAALVMVMETALDCEAE